MFGLKPQGTSLFGGSQSSSSPTPNPFGQPTQQQQQQPQSSSGGPGPSFLGGTTGGLFGNTLGTQQPQTQTGGLFGGTSTATQPQASGLFGNTTTTTQPQTGGLFGNSTSTTQPQTSGLFNTTQPQTSSLFGANTTTQPQTGSLFGANTTTQPGSLFGANTTPQPQTGGLFGTSTTTQPQSNLFGSTTGPSGGGFFGTSSQSQQQQPTGSSAFGGGSFFGSKPQQTQQLQITPAWTHIVLTKTTKFNDLPEDMRKELESLDTFIQSQSQISKDLHQRKLGEEPLKGYELIKGVNKDFVNCNSNIRHDLHFMRDLKAKVDRAVGDTIVATRIIDGFRNPQSGSGVGYLKEHAGFPFEFFSRVTEQIAARLSWYKATIEQIERKLTSTSHAQTPHSIAAALQAQHQTFLALASKTAALDAELQKIKTLYTQLWRQKTGSMRDPFDELDKGAGTDLGLEALSGRRCTAPFPQLLKWAHDNDIVSGEQYRYALTNFRIAHEKVEQQRHQLEEQERQVAQLRARIALLEGVPNSQRLSKSGNTVDDFSIKNSASQLDKLINRWASEMAQESRIPLLSLAKGALAGIAGGAELELVLSSVTSLQVSSYLRHAMSDAITDGIVNCLMVTNSTEANIQLTRIHEHLFSRDPTVAGVWRRQTFSAAVESVTQDMSLSILQEQMPELISLLGNQLPATGGTSLLDSAYDFSRMLHGSAATSGDIFYRAFVPEIMSILHARQIELVKRCIRSERGEVCLVGATLFPGLVKVSRSTTGPETGQTVVRRAQVICECALLGGKVM